jgi:hypothetical protein
MNKVMFQTGDMGLKLVANNLTGCGRYTYTWCKVGEFDDDTTNESEQKT